MSLNYFFKILLFSGFLSIFNSCQPRQEKSTSLILIRHAEKIISSSDNPDLSSKGRQRAANLVDLFEAVSIDAIYATPYLRTVNTAKPLATGQQRIDPFTAMMDNMIAGSGKLDPLDPTALYNFLG